MAGGFLRLMTEAERARYRAARRAIATGALVLKLRTSPGDLIRTRYLLGEIDEPEAERRLRVWSWLCALLFPAGLLAVFLALRVIRHGSVFPVPVLLELAALFAPMGPMFALAVDRLIERPAMRRAAGQRKSLG